MTPTPRDWDQWGETWRARGASALELDAMLRRNARTRRALRLMPLFSLGITIVALVVIAAALRHAANVFEAALGVAVALGIVVAWMADLADRRWASAGVEATAEQYATVRRAYCERRLRFARLGLMVAALDLVFLTPWWIGGIKVHGIGYGYAHLLSVWLPLAIILGFIAWTRRIRRRTQSELQALARLTATADA